MNSNIMINKNNGCSCCLDSLYRAVVTSMYNDSDSDIARCCAVQPRHCPTTWYVTILLEIK